MKTGFAVALLAVAMLCACALAQENTTEYWTMIGDDLAMNESNYQGALVAFEKAIQIDPENMGAWDRKALIHYVLSKQAYLRVLSLSEKWLENNPQDARAWQARAAALQSLDRIDESNQSLEKAIEIYDQETRENPGNATAWFYKAEVMANRTDALAAYEKVIELNGSMKITAMLTKGNILLNLGKSEEAIAVIDNAIQLNPKNPQAWKEKALDSYVLGKYNESLAAYEMVIELEPEYAPAWIWKGKGDALKALGRQSEADAAYARAEELDIDSSAPVQENAAQDWYRRGNDLERNGSYEDAVNAYDKAIEINPKYTAAWSDKGRALSRMAIFPNSTGKYNESLKAFDKAIELDPLNSTIWSFKGQTLTSMATFTGNESIYNESLEALDNALQIDPKNPQAWDFKGATLMSMRRNNESVEAFDRAIENIGRYQGNQTEELSGLWLTRAVVLQQAGRMNEALLSFDKAVQIVPEYYDARMMRGRALFNLGEYNLSIEDFDAAASNTERSPSAMANAWISKADALMKIGKYEDAKAIYDKTVELNYSADAFGTDTYYLARGWQGEGNVLAKLGSYNESLQAFDKAIELRPYFVYEVWSDKGLALSEMERYDEAIDAYDRAIEATAETDSPRAWIGKGNLLDKMGKHDEAIKAYDEAIKICDKFLELYPLNGDAWYYKGATLKALGRNVEADAAFAKADNRWFSS